MAISQFYQSWQAVPLHYFLQPSVWRFFALEIPVIALLSFVVVVIAREILSPIRQYRGPFLASMYSVNSQETSLKQQLTIYFPRVDEPLAILYRSNRKLSCSYQEAPRHLRPSCSHRAQHPRS